MFFSMHRSANESFKAEEEARLEIESLEANASNRQTTRETYQATCRDVKHCKDTNYPVARNIEW